MIEALRALRGCEGQINSATHTDSGQEAVESMVKKEYSGGCATRIGQVGAMNFQKLGLKSTKKFCNLPSLFGISDRYPLVWTAF